MITLRLEAMVRLAIQYSLDIELRLSWCFDVNDRRADVEPDCAGGSIRSESMNFKVFVSTPNPCKSLI